MFSRKIILFFLFSVFVNADTVNVTADNFFADENKLISILTGNVVLKKGDYDTLKADKLTIYFDKEKNPSLIFQRGKRFKFKNYAQLRVSLYTLM